MQLTVVLRNKTPIHSSDPKKTTIDTDGTIGRATAMPYIRMRRMKVIAASNDGRNEAKAVPVVPSNTMRNVLRRSALSSIFDQLRGSASLSIGAYAATVSGSASGNPDGIPATFDETLAVRNHVFLGLFGGGPRMIKGRLSVDQMFPIISDTQRLIGEGFEDRIITGSILDNVWARRIDPVEKISIEGSEEVITDAIQSITEWSVRNQGIKTKTKAKRELANAAKNGGVDVAPEEFIPRGLNSFNCQEVVVPGVDWIWSIKLTQPTNGQVGLILKAIGDIQFKDLDVGGGNARNYGRVSIQEVLLDGNSVWDGQSFSHESLEPYFDALAESLDGLNADDFENFARSLKDQD